MTGLAVTLLLCVSYAFSHKLNRSGFNQQAPGPVYKSAQVTIWRWREDIQNDFDARMCWATKSYKECNHPRIPAPALPKQLTVKAGDQFYLDATGSYDPDGDSLSYYWFQYQEASHSSLNINFQPPPLTRYARVIVHIVPK